MTTDSPQDEVMELIHPESIATENEVTDDVDINQDTEKEAIESVDDLDLKSDSTIDRNSDAYLAGQDDMKSKMQSALDRRISKEIGKRKLIENEVGKFRGELEDLKKSLYKAPVAPKLDDFIESENPEESFVEASIKYHTSLNKEKTPSSTPSVMSEEEENFSVLESNYASSHGNYYGDVQNLKGYMSNESLKDAIFSSIPEVSHILSHNLDVVERLSQMKPSQIGREIAKIEMSIKKGKPIPKRAKPKPELISESRVSSSGFKDISTMSQSQYNKYMSEAR